MAMSSRSALTTEKTIREILPDGKVKVTTIIETRSLDGSTSKKEEIKIIDSSPATVNNAGSNSAEAASARRRVSIGRFKFPNFFQSIGKRRQSKSTVSAPALNSTPPSSFKLLDFRQQLLRLHNARRAQHGAANLTLNDNLNNIAQNWAEHLSKTCTFQHRPRSQYGENIFTGYSSVGPIPVSAEQVIESWYSEVKNYNYNRPSTSSGHFTQMVWKGSKEVGFGCAVSKDGSEYVVANYSPAGNVLGQFKENVCQSVH